MLCLIISILVTAGLFISLGFRDEEKDNGYGGTRYVTVWKVNPRQFFALFGLLICLLGCFTKIPANSVGIVYSPFGGTKEETLDEGFARKNIFDKVYKISTETQTSTVENLTTQTKDAQYVTSILDIKYKVNSADAYMIFKQYRTLDRMSESLIIPTTQRVLELITTKYNVVDILGESRTEIYNQLEIALEEEFATYGVDFDSITIVDMDAGEELEAAITAEAVAKKAVETAEQELLKAETEAKKQSVEAQATQDAAKIKAETKIINAEATAEANSIIEESLTEEVLQKLWIEKWDGKLPEYYGGSEDGLSIILDDTEE